MYTGQNFINGAWSSEPSLFAPINPATEESYGVFPNSSLETVRSAVEAAKQAFDSWRKLSRVKRAEYFDSLAQLIKRDHEVLKTTISLETGKNLNESHAEVIEALHMCQVAAASGREAFGECVASELATKDAYVIRKPRGVVAVIAPWNFPLAIGSFWSSAPALVEGNTVVHKPSELTPMIAEKVARLYEEAGFPPGVYNLVHGDGKTGSALVHSDVNVILFTGSAEVGTLIKEHCATCYNKTCCVELGSKSATIVFEDGNMDLAVDVSLASAFKLSGQRCVSSGRLLVQRSVFDKFVDSFLTKVGQVITCDPFSAPKDVFSYGPLISQEQLEKVQRFNDAVIHNSHRTVLYPGGRLEGKGFFMTPFVYKSEWEFVYMTGSSRLTHVSALDSLHEEVFGPHVAIVPFDDLDHAIKIYNNTEYGLALGVVSDDFRKHRRIAQECDTGMLYINSGSIAAESHLPFSSWKKSGWGASAAATYKAVTHSMAITVNYEEGKAQWAQGMK